MINKLVAFTMFLLILPSFLPNNSTYATMIPSVYTTGCHAEWDEVLSVMPIKFRGKNTSFFGDILNGESAEAADNIVRQNFSFFLPNTEDCSLFKLNDKWIERIKRQEFIKRLENKIWIIFYSAQPFPDLNIIQAAYQTENGNWENKFSFINEVDPTVGSRRGIEFWHGIKVMNVVIHKIVDSDNGWKKITWLRLKKIVEFEPSDLNPFALADGEVFTTQGIRIGDNVKARIVESGILVLHPKTNISSVQSKENNKSPLVSVGNESVRYKKLSIEYLLNNYKKHFFTISFDTESKTLLSIGVPFDVTSDTVSNPK